MSNFVPAQNTVYTRGMTCAFWGRGMPCKNGNSCKYAHHLVEGGRLAGLPRRDRRTGQCFAGRNRWEFEEAKRQSALVDQRRREQEHRTMQYQYWLWEEEERQRKREQQQQEEHREQERLQRVYADYIQRQHRVQQLQQLQHQQQQEPQNGRPNISIPRTRTPLFSPALSHASISTLCLGAPLSPSPSPSPSPTRPSSLSHLSPSSSSTIAVDPWNTARKYWDNSNNNDNNNRMISTPVPKLHSPEHTHGKWLNTFMPQPAEKVLLFGTRDEWDLESNVKSRSNSGPKMNVKTPEEFAYREAVYRRTGIYPFPAPPKRKMIA